MIRVLLVDDQELVRAGLRGILRDHYGFDVVGECGNGSEVFDSVDALGPDVVVMDVRMPVMDGVEATRRLRERSDAPPVLALTTFDDDEVLADALRAGAAGFVLKGAPAEELQAAVRVVAEGGSWLDPAVTGRVLDTYRAVAPVRSPRAGDLRTLTARELEVLARIGRGQTNAEIARDLFVSEGTVKTHVNHVFAKLHLRDRAAAVVFAFDHQVVRPGSGPLDDA
jgi:DNA-binding NarL/FixJ family response regulator